MASGESRELHRGIGTRQLSMIAIGGAIGTGLFFASGGAIAQAGPGGALLAYATMGVAVYCMMQSLGEMATQLPIRLVRGVCGTIYRPVTGICGRLELLVQLGDHAGSGIGRRRPHRTVLVSAFELDALGHGFLRGIAGAEPLVGPGVCRSRILVRRDQGRDRDHFLAVGGLMITGMIGGHSMSAFTTGS